MPARILIHADALAGLAPLADTLAAAGHAVTLAQLPADDGSEGDWEARRWTAVNRLAADLRPDLLVVDQFPFGRRHLAFELAPLIQIVVARGGRVAVALPDGLSGERDAALDADAAVFARDWVDLFLVPEGFPADTALVPLADRLRLVSSATDAVAALHPLL